ncbi:MAG: TIGR00725 family protein [Thermoplasmatota archaeon]
MMRINISVCGSDGDDEKLENHPLEVAEIVGRGIARRGGVLICGGRSGIMEAACRGVRSEGGISIGILPYTKKEANAFIDIGIPTALGHKRNYLVVNSGDVIIAIGGRWGTLNEISYAMILQKPLILIKGTGGCVDEIITGNIMNHVESTYHVVESGEEAVEKAFEFLQLL